MSEHPHFDVVTDPAPKKSFFDRKFKIQTATILTGCAALVIANHLYKKYDLANPVTDIVESS